MTSTWRDGGGCDYKQADGFTASVAPVHAGGYSVALFAAGGRVLRCERISDGAAAARQRAERLLDDAVLQARFDALAASLDALRTPAGNERRAALGLL